MFFQNRKASKQLFTKSSKAAAQANMDPTTPIGIILYNGEASFTYLGALPPSSSPSSVIFPLLLPHFSKKNDRGAPW